MISFRPKRYHELLVAVMVGASSMAFALRANGQGALIFQNGSESRITNSLTLQPAEVGMAVALYISLDTNAPDSELTLASATQTNLFVPGIFSRGYVVISNEQSSPLILIRAQVRAWSQQYATYDDAVASGDPNVLAGRSNPFLFFLVTPASGLPVFTTAGLMQPFLVGSVPEPSPLFLGLTFVILFLLLGRRRRL